MAAERTPDEILLNALADGELSPAEQAAAAARLASDRDFARAYATLSRLKASIADLTKDDASEPLALALPPERRPWIGYAAAAGVAAVLLAGSVAMLWAPSLPRPAGQVAVSAAPVVPATFAGDPVIPDLSSAGLQLARTVVSASSGTQYLIATYLGPRGCKLELWVSSTPSPSSAPAGTARRNWRVDGLLYELVAFGMPASRFEKVAVFAERATRATTLPDEAAPLVQARIPRPPCVT